MNEKPLTAASDNLLMWRMGEACRLAADAPAGDYIDRGLILLRLLNEKGLDVVQRANGGHLKEREVDVLYRFNNLAAMARAQALHLHSTREGFILREYIDYQMFAEAASLDEVEKAIERRKADQSERTVRLRELATRR